MESKLKIACDELDKFLSSLSQPNSPSPEVKLLSAAVTSTTTSSSYPSEAYRCKCSFQIVADDNDDLSCVVRENGSICHLPGGIFLPANFRIRKAMMCLMKLLNKRNDIKERRGDDAKTTHTFQKIRENLTSVTFDTSWDEVECLATLHYGPPGLPQACEWKNEAQRVCDECQFAQVTGRSKGIKISVLGSTSSESLATAIDNGSILEEDIIRDTIWLELKMPIDDKSTYRVISVSMVQPNQSADILNVPIQYQKPATAFQHPNAGVMLTSLLWILQTISKVAEQQSTKPRLLEMYCGCGAHTIPLAKSTLISEIVAVELDERLVNACKNNCRLNNCLKGEESEYGSNETLVDVFKGDAAEWAVKTLRCIHKKNRVSEVANTDNATSLLANDYNQFDILLVDPPRQGLDKTVCEMAIKGTFSHLLYISCGRRALIRDLTILCTEFAIEDLAVIDLFPGTDAVETLIHLKRKH